MVDTTRCLKILNWGIIPALRVLKLAGWRNGSASGFGPEGCAFESRPGRLYLFSLVTGIFFANIWICLLFVRK